MKTTAASGDFAVVGAAHVDHVARISTDLVVGASNPGQARQTVGGASYNAAMALRAFEATVAFLGVRGGDAAGERVAEALAEAGIADRSATWMDRSTPGYTAVLDAAGELVVGVADMALYDKMGPRLLARRAVRDWLGAAATVLTDANLPSQALEMLARSTDGRLAAIGVSPTKVLRLMPILPRLDALFLARREAVALTALPEDAAASALAVALAERGVRRSVVTDGPRPAAILEDGVVYAQDPPSVPAVSDVTGAGDTLAAIALLAFVEGRPFRDAARLGIAAASLKITGRLQPGCRSTCEAIAAALAPSDPLIGWNA